jgi:intracellular sulfur oxidation DsrE/DsrF family protein
MTYEEYLDEVTTLLTELYELEDAAAIKLVVDAQDAEFFTRHDDLPEMRTLEQAKNDAVTLFEDKQKKQQTQKKQQQRVQQKKKNGPAR